MEPIFWPLKKSSKTVSQSFGVRWSANKKKRHTGLDIVATVGEPVFAVVAGRIVKIGNCGKDPDGNDWAKYIILEHASKEYCTGYLHIDPKVTVGQQLNAGETVGSVADLKSSTHLHFHVLSGTDISIAPRGALPAPESAELISSTNPAFPHNFVDPVSFSYRYIDGEAASEPSTGKQLFARDLYNGCSGQDVKLLQQLLNKDQETQISAGGVGSSGKETDYFGDLTEAAVKKFQTKYGIASSDNRGYGRVGPKTREKIEEIFRNA